MFLIKADEALGHMHAFIIERKTGIIFTINYMSSCHKSLKGKEQKMQQQLHKEKKQENFLLSFMDYVSVYIKAIVKR